MCKHCHYGENDSQGQRGWQSPPSAAPTFNSHTLAVDTKFSMREKE